MMYLRVKHLMCPGVYYLVSSSKQLRFEYKMILVQHVMILHYGILYCQWKEALVSIQMIRGYDLMDFLLDREGSHLMVESLMMWMSIWV